ncbi:hypothetical protein [Acinetobacter beijerinckii]|uniref:hypothetical protein n=1 Tax=Acinetobacter beijerinckii TaxID=262668 RepID=UPI0024061915|nr:hypothetical protein [Acinetobacter beijerinckii]
MTTTLEKTISLVLLGILLLLLVASCSNPSYATVVQQKTVGLALVGYQDYIGAYSPLRAFFMRTISMHSHVMAKLERDIFGCAGFLCHQSTNPLQLCHPHLVVNGKALIKHIGEHAHA